MRPAHVHNLRGNKAERSPHRLFVYDTETDRLEDGRREVHQLRLWCAEVVQRHGRRPSKPDNVAHQGRTLGQLVDALEGACRSSETLWAYAHGHTFDLGVTRLPVVLQHRGWSITAHALASPSPWARLQRGGHRLVLADSASWLPGPLAGIGDALGIPKLEMPDFEGPDDAWWARCRQDVMILRHALVQLLDWWDRRKLGSWSVTGPQTGFNLARHLPRIHTVVIAPDPEARAFERLAVTGGRRECWQLGQLGPDDFREIDFHLAHATIAASCPLPKRRGAPFTSMDLDDWRLTSDRWAPLAWAVVRTNVPRYPLTLGGRLWYPIGTFRTVLAGPEIAEAARRRELLAVGPGWVYQLGAHMGEWGRWVLQQLGEPDPDTPEVGRTAIRYWSRVVMGKWAARSGRTMLEGPGVTDSWSLTHGIHHPSGARCGILEMAGHRQILVQDQDADDSFPAVLAWVQSHVRVALGRLVDAVTPEYMVSCNTDGLVCRWSLRVQEALEGVDCGPLTPRIKARYRRLDVISPQHLVLDQRRRLSGVPGGAEEVDTHQYRWITWPRLPQQIAAGDPRGYVREPRTADLRNVPVNRWVTDDGACVPVSAALEDGGQNRLLPWVTSWTGGPAWGLRPVQHPVLAELAEEEDRL